MNKLTLLPQVEKNQSYDAPPLNFSFKNIEELEDIKYIAPRQGKRKAIPKQDEQLSEDLSKQRYVEDDSNKVGIELALQGQKEDDLEQNEENGQTSPTVQVEVQKQDSIKKEKDTKKTPGMIAPQTNNAMKVIFENNIPLSGSGMAQQGKGTQMMAPKRVTVDIVCASLILSYNHIRSIINFYPIMDQVLFDLQKLQWIDLSHNYIEKLDYDFKELDRLKTLYLHENYISELEDLQKLSELPLRSVSVHGNPFDQIPNFRGYVIGILPKLIRLDSVLISKKERDNANFMINKFKYKIKPLKNPAKPPPKPIRKKLELATNS